MKNLDSARTELGNVKSKAKKDNVKKKTVKTGDNAGSDGEENDEVEKKESLSTTIVLDQQKEVLPAIQLVPKGIDGNLIVAEECTPRNILKNELNIKERLDTQVSSKTTTLALGKTDEFLEYNTSMMTAANDTSEEEVLLLQPKVIGDQGGNVTLKCNPSAVTTTKDTSEEVVLVQPKITGDQERAVIASIEFGQFDDAL